MTTSKNCRDRFEDIVALVMDELDLGDKRELQDHIIVCATCREARDLLIEEEKQVRSDFETLAGSVTLDDQGARKKREYQLPVGVGQSNNHFHERVKTMIFAHKRLSFAAATTVAAAASLILYVSLLSAGNDAYALEQTAQANNHVTSYHVKITPAAELGEAWIEVNSDGTPKRARMHLQSSDDGTKVIIFTGKKAEVWFKDKKTRLFITANDALKELMAKRNISDPKIVFEKLQAQKEAGKVDLVTEEPGKEGDPITLTVTSKDTPSRQAVYEVDPDSKLVKRVMDYRRNGDEWEQVEMREYLDYNKSIDPELFELELPEDVITIDQIENKVGLLKGNLSDNEIAMKLTKEFVEAVIAEDFETAGALYSGIPAATLKQRFQQSQLRFLRIVKIGTATPNPKTRSILVPISVELEVAGKKIVQELSPSSRAVDGQPHRWQIIGGI
jgi:hypothetical protein